MNKPLNAAQQLLVAKFHTLTKGGGATRRFGKDKPGKARQFRALQLEMLAAKVPHALIYGF